MVVKSITSLDKTTYLRVSKDQNGQPFFLAMNEEEIQQFKQSAKEQVHTLPRVDQSLACAPATTPVVIKKFTLHLVLYLILIRPMNKYVDQRQTGN